MMRILPLDDRAPASLLVSWHTLSAATDVELEPYLPPAPFDEALALTQSDDLNARHAWLAVDDDAVVAYAVLGLPLLDNPHLAMLDVRVDIGRRRAGLGTALTRLAARAALDAGRRTLLIEAVDRSPGAAMCKGMGGDVAIGDTPSVLRLADLDQALVDRWIARRDERAAGYSLTRWAGACPDELLDGFARLREAMNTAPLGALDLTIEWTPASVRAAERSHARCGHRNLVLCARHDESGELVAVTDVIVPTGRPTVALQEDTVVVPEHRNRGLGRWLKAEMLRWLAHEAPRVDRVATWNATENAAMRAINAELGFKPAAAWSEWQFTIETLAKRLVA